MSRLASAWLAWSVWALCVVLLALAVLLDYQYTPPSINKGDSPVYQFFGVPSLVYATVGAFVASRRPRNLVGWLLCVIGLVLAVMGFSTPYADYALLVEPASSLPGAVYMACVSQTLVAVPVLIATAILLILLFPDGRLSDRRLRAVPWVVVGGSATSALWAVTSEDDVFERYSLRNPLWAGGIFGDAVDMIGRLGTVTFIICVGVAVLTVFVRLENARGAERQQLKWFAYAAVVLFGTLIFFPVTAWILPYWAGFPLGIAGLSAIPVAVGIAVLRYRLYDIDRVINRTLVYGSLTGVLALVYFGGVTVTQATFQSFTGQEEPPQLIIVTSTLVIAALFSPLRRIVQSFVDRRFYRRKYDARKTLEGFSATLRDETDLDALNDGLVGVVRETVQPAHVSLWLRPNATPKGHQGG
jgi:hypothetical protein